MFKFLPHHLARGSLDEVLYISSPLTMGATHLLHIFHQLNDVYNSGPQVWGY